VPQPRRSLCVELRDFIISADDVPEQVQKAITHWSQWIDYWAVDWDFKGDTFHNQWQSYQAKKKPKLELHAQHTYESSGTYTVVIKVIDILGNDTTKSVRVEVR
jgi:adenine-specific DNA-methyltransferase